MTFSLEDLCDISIVCIRHNRIQAFPAVVVLPLNLYPCPLGAPPFRRKSVPGEEGQEMSAMGWENMFRAMVVTTEGQPSRCC